MKKTIVTGFIVAIFMTLSAFANQPGNCAPLGRPNLGPPPPYDYIANGLPWTDSCWDEWAATFTTYYDACGSYQNYWEFGYSGSLTQTFTIPDHPSTLNFSYKLDFDDPNHDGYWNRFQSQVTDLTTGRILAGEFRTGSSPSLFCSMRRFTITAPYDLAGHNIQVHFSGSKGYTNTHIRVSYVSLTTP